MARMLLIKIDVSKIDKDKLYKGKSGTYLDAVAWENDGEDTYGNHFSIKQSQTKEEREAGNKVPYLGNAKWLGGGSPKASEPVDKDDDDDDEIPF